MSSTRKTLQRLSPAKKLPTDVAAAAGAAAEAAAAADAAGEAARVVQAAAAAVSLGDAAASARRALPLMDAGRDGRVVPDPAGFVLFTTPAASTSAAARGRSREPDDGALATQRIFASQW
jgi:hypothetical protein